MKDEIDICFDPKTDTICVSVPTDNPIKSYDAVFDLLGLWWDEIIQKKRNFSLLCDFKTHLPPNYIKFITNLVYFLASVKGGDGPDNPVVCTAIVLRDGYKDAVDLFLSLYTPQKPFKLCQCLDEGREFIKLQNKNIDSK